MITTKKLYKLFINTIIYQKAENDNFTISRNNKQYVITSIIKIDDNTIAIIVEDLENNNEVQWYWEYDENKDHFVDKDDPTNNLKLFKYNNEFILLKSGEESPINIDINLYVILNPTDEDVNWFLQAESIDKNSAPVKEWVTNVEMEMVSPGIKLPDGQYVTTVFVDDQEPDEQSRGEFVSTVIVSDGGNKLALNPKFSMVQKTINGLENIFTVNEEISQMTAKRYDEVSKNYIDNQGTIYKIVEYDTKSNTGNTQSVSTNGIISYGSIYLSNNNVSDYESEIDDENINDSVYSDTIKKLPFLKFLPTNDYNGCSCKKPYNIFSLAILLLDPFAPGYFVNIPNTLNTKVIRNKTQFGKESLFGRGCEEAAWNEFYFLTVSILKLVVLQILINRYVYESATGNTTVRKRDKILLTIAIGVGVQLLIPMILTIVLDILNGQGKKIGSDIKYILTKPKNWLHLIPQTAYSLLFV